MVAQINIRVDDQLKEQGETLFRSLGMNMTTAISIFLSQSVRDGGIPFSIKMSSGETPNETTVRAMKDAEEGRVFRAKNVRDILDD